MQNFFKIEENLTSKSVIFDLLKNKACTFSIKYVFLNYIET